MCSFKLGFSIKMLKKFYKWFFMVKHVNDFVIFIIWHVLVKKVSGRTVNVMLHSVWSFGDK